MDEIAIGRVRTAFGVRGWLKLYSYSGEWDHFATLESVVLKNTRPRGRKECRIEGFRMHHGGGLFKLEGIDTPEAGKSLVGWDILAPRDRAAPLDDGEWYWSDLVGLEVQGEDQDVFGEIVGVIESSDDLLEILRPDGIRFLVPFRSQFVGEPDLELGRVILRADWLADQR